MTIDPVIPTPPVWINDFAENLTALKSIQIKTQSQRPALYPAVQDLITRGDAIKARIYGAISGKTITADNAAQIYKGFEPIENDAHQWLQDSADLAQRLQSDISFFGVEPVQVMQQAGTAAKTLETWVNDIHVDAMTRLQEINAALSNLEKEATNIFGEIPWLWIGLGVAAIFILPPLLREFGGDDT